MNGSQHIAPQATGNSAAAQALSLLGGQGQTRAQGLGLGGAQGGAFAALIQALSNQQHTLTGIKTSGKGQTGQAAAQALLLSQAGGTAGNAGNGIGTANTAGASGTPSLGQLLSLYKGANGSGSNDTAKGDQGQNPLLSLINSLSQAGINISDLPLPPGILQQLASSAGAPAGTSGLDGAQLAGLKDAASTQAADIQAAQASPAQESRKDDKSAKDGAPLAALVAVLAALADAPQSASAAQAGNASKSTTAQKIEDLLAGSTQKDQTAAAGAKTDVKPSPLAQLLASLTPQDKAKVEDALKQLQSQAQSQAADTAPKPQTSDLKVAQPQTSDVKAPQVPKAPDAAVHTDQSARQTPVETALAKLTQQTAQSGNGASPAGQAQPASSDTAAAAITSQLPQHVARDLKVKVTHDSKAAHSAGAPGLLSSKTAAGIIAAAQGGQGGQAGTQGQGGQADNAPGQLVAALATTKSGKAAEAGDPLANIGKDTTSSSGDVSSFGDSLKAAAAHSSLDQLDSSVVKMARQPMTLQAPPAQVAVQIAKAAEQGVNRFVVQLSPASLGDVDVHMHVDKDGRVHAMLHVERPETLQLLQKDSQHLHQALENAGLKPDSGSLSFSLKQDGSNFAFNGNGNGHGNGTAPGSGMSLDDTETLDAPAPIASRSHNGQLDVTI